MKINLTRALLNSCCTSRFLELSLNKAIWQPAFARQCCYTNHMQFFHFKDPGLSTILFRFQVAFNQVSMFSVLCLTSVYQQCICILQDFCACNEQQKELQNQPTLNYKSTFSSHMRTSANTILYNVKYLHLKGSLQSHFTLRF